MSNVSSDEVRLALDVLKDWATSNQRSSIDWRKVTASGVILSEALLDGATKLGMLKEAVGSAKQNVKRAEGLAYLRALSLLMSGRAVLPSGEPLPKTSYTSATHLARTFVSEDDQVKQAGADLVQAEAALMEFEAKLDAIKNLSMDAKSTAKNLMGEVGR